MESSVGDADGHRTAAPVTLFAARVCRGGAYGGRRAQQWRGIGGGDGDELAAVSGSSRRWQRRPESVEAAAAAAL